VDCNVKVYSLTHAVGQKKNSIGLTINCQCIDSLWSHKNLVTIMKSKLCAVTVGWQARRVLVLVMFDAAYDALF